MKFGYQQPNHTFTSKTIFESLKQIAGECEEQDYDSFWVMDHLLQIGLAGKNNEPIMEAYTTLAALAPVTKKIKLGALCTCTFFRNPALLAKMGATIDQISNGRFWLGLGAGWYKEEAISYGYKFQDNLTRLQMLEEALQIIELAWTKNKASFEGRFYSIKDFILSPKPVQRPRPPILVGGEGEKVTLRLVAKYADACNFFASGKELERKLDVLKTHCKKQSRSYSKILKTKLSSVMFGKNKYEALQKISSLKPREMDLDSYAESFLLGNPSEISSQVEDLKEIGIEYLIINFRGKYNPKDTLAFSKEIMTRF